MDNKPTDKNGRHYFRFDPKKTTPKEMVEFLKNARTEIRKAEGLPVDSEPEKK